MILIKLYNSSKKKNPLSLKWFIFSTGSWKIKLKVGTLQILLAATKEGLMKSRSGLT